MNYFVAQTSVQRVGSENQVIIKFPGIPKFTKFETQSSFTKITGFSYSQTNVLEWIKKCVDLVVKKNNEDIEYLGRKMPIAFSLKYEVIETDKKKSFTYLCHDEKKVITSEIFDVPSFLDDIYKYRSFVKDVSVYYRGQLANWQMTPSLFRHKEWVQNEAQLNARILSNRPNDFSHCNSFFEKLVVLKHYNQPSRLLDITSNPLIALYFSCRYMEEIPDGIGAVNCVYGESSNKEKFAIMSDTVNMITALAYTKNKCSECNSYPCPKEKTQTCDFLRELKYQLKQHHGFLLWNDLNLSKLDTCILVHPPLNNQRIIRQQGLFLLCGRNSNRWIEGTCDPDGNFEPDFGEEKQYDVPESLYSYFIYEDKQKCYYITRKNYKKILAELSILGIDDYFVFGDLEKSIEITKKEYL